mmetsp:Transcript_6744/g.11480  ORF Transcript_6744/g.11480 Transcript_6744/m.11480 type:complete len:863 (-) Transcript_6744:436-3024(-)
MRLSASRPAPNQHGDPRLGFSSVRLATALQRRISGVCFVDSRSQQSVVTGNGVVNAAGAAPFDLQALLKEAGDSFEQPDAAQDIAGPTSPSTWQDWLPIFERMDTASEREQELQAQLKSAIFRENYSIAAAVKGELAAIQDEDLVSAVQQDLADALSSEDYATAARLRDQGMTSVQGWWAGTSELDPSGHVLLVEPEFGRYTGRAYSARDIAELKGWREGAKTGALGMLRRGSLGGPTQRGRASTGSSSTGSASPPATPPAVRETPGSPALEIFLAPGPATGSPAPGVSPSSRTGNVVSQVVSLLGGQAPLQKEQQQDKREPGSARSRGGAARGAGLVTKKLSKSLVDTDMVRIVVSISKDGTANIVATPPTPAPPGLPRSRFNARDAEEVAATMRELAELSDVPAPSASAETEQQETTKAANDDQEEVTKLPEEPKEEERLPQATEGYVEAKSAVNLADIVSQALSGSIIGKGEDVSALRDVLADMVLDISADAGAVEIDATASYEPSTSDEDEERTGGDADKQDIKAVAELRRRPAKLELLNKDLMLLNIPLDPPLKRAVSAPSRVVDEGQLVSKFQVLLTLTELRQLQKSDKPNAALSQVVETVSKAQAAQTGGSLAAAEPVVRVALAALAQRVLAGESVAVSVPPPAPEDETPAMTAMAVRNVGDEDQNELAGVKAAPIPKAAARALKPPPVHPTSMTIKYSRISVETPRSADLFSGLYLGRFGSHGPEILSLKRGQIGGEEAVIGTKITGDANVPAGTISFRCKVGPTYKLSSKDVFPDELGVIARYQGEGRIAEKGFQDAKWCGGELLVFSPRSPLTAGAELGFVFNVPGERRFLILLDKLNLQVPSNKTAGKSGR